MSEFVARAPATWIVDHVPAAATAAVATKAAVANTRHFLTGFAFSLTGGVTTVETIQIKHGTTVVLTVKVDSDTIYTHEFARPLRNANPNELVSLTVSAPAGAEVGTATIWGFSKKE